MNILSSRGVAVMPVVVIGAIVIGLGAYLALRPEPSIEPSEIATSTIDTATDRRPLPIFKQSAWRGGAVNTSKGVVAAGQMARQSVYLGPGRAVVAVQVADESVGVSLVAPDGTVISPQSENVIYEVKTDGSADSTTISYTIPDNTKSGEWTVVIADQDDEEDKEESDDTDYVVTTPDASPPLSVSDGTAPVVSNTQGVDLSLVVEETVSSPSGFVVQTVSGAVVVATITTPSGDSSSIQLTEDEDNPGTYSGVYTGNTETGTYQVEYEITGQNSAGQQFTQTTYGQFEVTTEPDVSTGSANWTKKFDINRSNQIRILNY